MSERIRLARAAAKLTQAVLAKTVGVTPSAVAQWESRLGTRPGVERLQAVAAATGVAFDWLATGIGGNARRSPAPADDPPAVVLSTFAHDANEELLLDRYRRLPLKAREALCNLLVGITSRSR